MPPSRPADVDRATPQIRRWREGVIVLALVLVATMLGLALDQVHG